jgi:hypothetical protein
MSNFVSTIIQHTFSSLFLWTVQDTYKAFIAKLIKKIIFHFFLFAILSQFEMKHIKLAEIYHQSHIDDSQYHKDYQDLLL